MWYPILSFGDDWKIPCPQVGVKHTDDIWKHMKTLLSLAHLSSENIVIGLRSGPLTPTIHNEMTNSAVQDVLQMAVLGTDSQELFLNVECSLKSLCRFFILASHVLTKHVGPIGSQIFPCCFSSQFPSFTPLKTNASPGWKIKFPDKMVLFRGHSLNFFGG